MWTKSSVCLTAICLLWAPATRAQGDRRNWSGGLAGFQAGSRPPEAAEQASLMRYQCGPSNLSGEGSVPEPSEHPFSVMHCQDPEPDEGEEGSGTGVFLYFYDYKLIGLRAAGPSYVGRMILRASGASRAQPDELPELFSRAGSDAQGFRECEAQPPLQAYTDDASHCVSFDPRVPRIQALWSHSFPEDEIKSLPGPQRQAIAALMAEMSLGCQPGPSAAEANAGPPLNFKSSTWDMAVPAFLAAAGIGPGREYMRNGEFSAYAAQGNYAGQQVPAFYLTTKDRVAAILVPVAQKSLQDFYAGFTGKNGAPSAIRDKGTQNETHVWHRQGVRVELFACQDALEAHVRLDAFSQLIVNSLDSCTLRRSLVPTDMSVFQNTSTAFSPMGAFVWVLYKEESRYDAATKHFEAIERAHAAAAEKAAEVAEHEASAQEYAAARSETAALLDGLMTTHGGAIAKVMGHTWGECLTEGPNCDFEDNLRRSLPAWLGASFHGCRTAPQKMPPDFARITTALVKARNSGKAADLARFRRAFETQHDLMDQERKAYDDLLKSLRSAARGVAMTPPYYDERSRSVSITIAENGPGIVRVAQFVHFGDGIALRSLQDLDLTRIEPIMRIKSQFVGRVGDSYVETYLGGRLESVIWYWQALNGRLRPTFTAIRAFVATLDAKMGPHKDVQGNQYPGHGWADARGHLWERGNTAVVLWRDLSPPGVWIYDRTLEGQHGAMDQLRVAKNEEVLKERGDLAAASLRRELEEHEATKRKVAEDL